MKTLHDRLAWARKQAGYDTASDGARAMGVEIPTYGHHENGTRGFRRESAQKYAKFYKVSLEWLLTGAGTPNGNTVRMIPVVGYIGAGAEIFGIDDHARGAGLDELEAPPGISADAVAVRVKGDSMYPAYREGDHIIYDQTRSGCDLTDLLGKECIVRLADGRTFLKTLSKGSESGFWTLISYNAPPMQDCVVDWAARVRWVEKA